jgi:hypothetical protein
LKSPLDFDGTLLCQVPLQHATKNTPDELIPSYGMPTGPEYVNGHVIFKEDLLDQTAPFNGIF